MECLKKTGCWEWYQDLVSQRFPMQEYAENEKIKNFSAYTTVRLTIIEQKLWNCCQEAVKTVNRHCEW